MQIVLLLFSLILSFPCFGQHISEFQSLPAKGADHNFHIPPTHHFQLLTQEGRMTETGFVMADKFDFTCFIPENQSSTKGKLSINFERSPGGVVIFDMAYDTNRKLWELSQGTAVNFDLVNGTQKNCAGTLTPWNTLVTCEEIQGGDGNGDGYNDFGWAIEIDPFTKTVIDQPNGLIGGDKLWALGNFKHENLCVHPNRKTAYQGVDSYGGYLFKFVADEAEKLHQGKLYVYRGSKDGGGKWYRIDNETPSQQNTVLQQAQALDATPFQAIEEVEYNPIDEKIYLAVTGENRVYRFTDDNPTGGGNVLNFETYVGNKSYEINTPNGTETVNWGTGNDNLAFDNLGNLWVLQDGNENYIWLVKNGHTQANPKVQIFGRTPLGSEPTGITFSPDFNFLFISIQHPFAGNEAYKQTDATGNLIHFGKDAALVIARRALLNESIQQNFTAFVEGKKVKTNWTSPGYLESHQYHIERSKQAENWEIIHNTENINFTTSGTRFEWEDINPISGQSYYRMRTIFQDGEELISDHVLVYNGSIQEDILVYPNPSKDQLTFSFPGNLNISSVEIFDGFSRKFELPMQLSGNRGVLQTSGLANGNYLLRIKWEDKFITIHKFVKAK